MKRLAYAAVCFLLLFMLGSTAFASDVYTFTPPEGYTRPDELTAFWANADQTANINIILEENEGINPFDLTQEDITELQEATAQAYTQGLAAYHGSVTGIAANMTDWNGMPVLRIEMDSSYTVADVLLQARQVQYVFFTKAHSIYVTATTLSDFADADFQLAAFEDAVAAMTLQDELYTEPSRSSNVLIFCVVIGAILGGAGGLALWLLRQKKAGPERETQASEPQVRTADSPKED